MEGKEEGRGLWGDGGELGRWELKLSLALMRGGRDESLPSCFSCFSGTGKAGREAGRGRGTRPSEKGAMAPRFGGEIGRRKFEGVGGVIASAGGGEGDGDEGREQAGEEAGELMSDLISSSSSSSPWRRGDGNVVGVLSSEVCFLTATAGRPPNRSFFSCSLALARPGNGEGGGEEGIGKELIGPRAWDILLTRAIMDDGLLDVGGDSGVVEDGLEDGGDMALLLSLGGRGGLRLQRGGVGSSCQEERCELASNMARCPLVTGHQIRGEGGLSPVCCSGQRVQGSSHGPSTMGSHSYT